MFEYNIFYTDITSKTWLLYLHIINWNGSLIYRYFLEIKLPPKMSSAHLNDKAVTKGDNNPKYYSKTTQ